MSDEISKIISKKAVSDPKTVILVLQICAAVIFILSAVVIRLLGGDFYKRVRNIYYAAVSVDTTIKSVTEAEPEFAEKPPKNTDGSAEQDKVIEKTQVVIETLGSVDEEVYSVKQADLKKGKKINTIIWPLEGVITSGYGYRNDPLTGKPSFHSGIDIAAESGTEIKTVAAGRVHKAEYSDSYGYFLIVDHTNGFMTLYAHCSRLCVKKGDRVAGGEIIALSGSSGRSTGPHLHFETILGGYKSNPTWLLPEV